MQQATNKQNKQNKEDDYNLNWIFLCYLLLGIRILSLVLDGAPKIHQSIKQTHLYFVTSGFTDFRPKAKFGKNKNYTTNRGVVCNY